MSKFKDHLTIFPAGVMRLPSPQERKPHDRTTKAEAAINTAKLNSLAYLTTHFLESNSLFAVQVADAIVKTIRPLSPFSYGGLMVFALDQDIASQADDSPEQLVPTKAIYDFPSATQVEYFRQIFASLRAFHQVHLPVKDGLAHTPIVIENAMADVSNRHHRLGRTIALPHAHIITASEAWINTTDQQPRTFRRATEQRFLTSEKLFEEFKAFFLAQTTQTKLPHFDLIQRALPPLGYTLATTIELHDNFDQGAQDLAQIMNFHHHSYTNFVHSSANRLAFERKNRPTDGHKILLPQPSYRVYLYVHEGYLRITISPVIIDSGGAIEASNIIIYRGPTVESVYTEAELACFTQALLEKLSVDLSSTAAKETMTTSAWVR